MHIKPYIDDEIAQILDEFKKRGGVVEFKIYKISSFDKESYSKHLAVAKRTLEDTREEINREFNDISAKLGESREKYFKMDIDFGKLESSGERVYWQDFFGSIFDPHSKIESLRGAHKFINSYFYYDSVEQAGNAINLDGDPKGFAYAFLEPPHRLEYESAAEKREIFLKFCDTLLGDINEAQIYSWSVDSSNYFECGKEWWGAFFWTLYNTKKDIYIGIAASATD